MWAGCAETGAARIRQAVWRKQWAGGPGCPAATSSFTKTNGISSYWTVLKLNPAGGYIAYIDK